jgi:hypothetical protein
MEESGRNAHPAKNDLQEERVIGDGWQPRGLASS